MQQGRRALDLANAGKEHEHVPGGLEQRALRRTGGRELWRERRDCMRARGRLHNGCCTQGRRAASQITNCNRVDAARNRDHDRIFEQAGHALAIERCRHHQNTECRTELPASIQSQRQTHVGLQGTLVILIENEPGDRFERGVFLQQASEYSFGNDLDAGRSGNAGVEAHAISDRSSNRLPAQRRHPSGHRAGCESARGSMPSVLCRPR